MVISTGVPVSIQIPILGLWLFWLLLRQRGLA